MFEMHIVSLSTNIKFPTPALVNASTTKLPTPPIPKTITFELCNLAIPSSPTNNSVLQNSFNGILNFSFNNYL